MQLREEFIGKTIIQSQTDLDSYFAEKFILEYRIEQGYDVEESKKKLEKVLFALNEIGALYDDED